MDREIWVNGSNYGYGRHKHIFGEGWEGWIHILGSVESQGDDVSKIEGYRVLNVEVEHLR